jgi:hypothetical protein
MKDRVKFQVWSKAQQRWRTTYCRISMVAQNIARMKLYGIKVRLP